MVFHYLASFYDTQLAFKLTHLVRTVLGKVSILIKLQGIRL